MGLESNLYKIMKYIIIGSALRGEYPVLFPDHINHGDMVNRFGGKVILAGKIEFYGKEGDIWIGGSSISLKLKSRNEDILLIKRSFRKDL